MSSPITLSGFNNIDFSPILTALMQIERQPVAQLEAPETALNRPEDLLRRVRVEAGQRSRARPSACSPRGAFHGRAATRLGHDRGVGQRHRGDADRQLRGPGQPAGARAGDGDRQRRTPTRTRPSSPRAAP